MINRNAIRSLLTRSSSDDKYRQYISEYKVIIIIYYENNFIVNIRNKKCKNNNVIKSYNMAHASQIEWPVIYLLLIRIIFFSYLRYGHIHFCM